jgi:hypothetical protein
MISTARLAERLTDGWVAFDKHGQPLDRPIPSGIGLATMVVAPVTDALKHVDPEGVITASIDRDEIWAVEAIILNVVVLDQLGDREMSIEGLLDQVYLLGHRWDVSPISSP